MVNQQVRQPAGDRRRYCNVLAVEDGRGGLRCRPTRAMLRGELRGTPSTATLA